MSDIYVRKPCGCATLHGPCYHDDNRAEIDRLKADLIEMRDSRDHSRDEVAALREEGRKLKAENERLTRQVSGLLLERDNDVCMTGLRTRVAELERERDEAKLRVKGTEGLEDKYMEAQRQWAHYEERCSTLCTRVEELEAERDILWERKSDAKGLTSKLFQKRAEIKDLRTRVAELEAEAEANSLHDQRQIETITALQDAVREKVYELASRSREDQNALDVIEAEGLKEILALLPDERRACDECGDGNPHKMSCNKNPAWTNEDEQSHPNIGSSFDDFMDEEGGDNE
jgi:chromosome segregation ATPase